MKVFINKLKKANKIFLAVYFITLLLYTILYIIFLKNIIHLTGIETAIRTILLIITGIWLIVYALWNLVNVILKKHVILTITTIVSIIFIGIFGFGNYYLKVLYHGIGNLAESEYVLYTSNLVVLNGTTIDNNSKLGMINSTDDIEGNVLAKELIKDKKLDQNEIINYSSYYEMIYDLLNGKVSGIFLTSNYMTIFGSEEDFKGLNNTKVYYTYSKKMKNQDYNIISNKSLTEPFTLLLMGVDSEDNGLDANAAFNGDTLMLITFNPKTLNATMFSIPRDTYVPIACNNNRYAKINSAAAYGTSCVLSTVKQLTDIDIDYYVKVNFKAVVDLVETLGGVTVDVEAPTYSFYAKAHNGQICEQDSLRRFDEYLICMNPGVQHLNGEQALAYARCRHAYLDSDIARNRHQQEIIEAIAKKVLSGSNITKVEDLLNAVTNNIATNMNEKQILSFYEVLKNMISKSFNDGEFLNIQKTYLEYYNLPVRLSNNGIFTSAIGYYPGSLEAISKAMKVNLGLEEKEVIKTFSFDANEDYKNKVIGEGINTGEKLETMPNFAGKSASEAETWANNHNIIIEKEFVNISSSNFNENVALGLIGNQSVSDGILLNNVSSFTIYINESGGVKTDTSTTEDNKNDDTTILDNNDEVKQEENNTSDLPKELTPSEDNNNEEENTNQN